MVTLSLFYLFVDGVLVTRMVQMGYLFVWKFCYNKVYLVGDFSLVFDFLIGLTHTENLCCCIVALRDLESRIKLHNNLKATTLRKIFYCLLSFWLMWAVIEMVSIVTTNA